MPQARGIRLLTCDVDGVLTDGRIYVDDDGRETKAFSALDGVGLKMLMHAGITVAWITGSSAPAVMHRARVAGRRARRAGRAGQADAVGGAARASSAAGRPPAPTSATTFPTFPFSPAAASRSRCRMRRRPCARSAHFVTGARRRHGRRARALRADPRRAGRAARDRRSHRAPPRSRARTAGRDAHDAPGARASTGWWPGRRCCCSAASRR